MYFTLLSFELNMSEKTDFLRSREKKSFRGLKTFVKRMKVFPQSYVLKRTDKYIQNLSNMIPKLYSIRMLNIGFIKQSITQNLFAEIKDNINFLTECARGMRFIHYQSHLLPGSFGIKLRNVYTRLKN